MPINDLPNLQIPNLTDSQKLYTGMVEHLMSVSTNLNSLQEDVHELNKVILLGNGDLPLREVVRTHENFINDIKYWIRFVGAAIILQTLIFAIAVATTYVKLSPVIDELTRQAKP